MRNPLLVSQRQWLTNEAQANVNIDGAGLVLVTLAAGTYYNDAPAANVSLAAKLQAALNTTLAPETFTVEWSTTTGKFTITCTSGTITAWNWVGTSFRDWMGFTGNMAGAAAFTSQNVAQGCIFAGSGRAKDTGLRAEKTGSNVITEDGTTIRIGTQSTRRLRSFTFEWEPPAAVASPPASGTDDEDSSVVPWTWFDFWEFHSRTGNAFRYYTQTQLAISAFERTYWLENTDKFEKAPKIPGKTTHWIVPLDVRLFIAG